MRSAEAPVNDGSAYILRYVRITVLLRNDVQAILVLDRLLLNQTTQIFVLYFFLEGTFEL